MKLDGSTGKYGATLVALNKMIFCIFDTDSPIRRITSFRNLLAIVDMHNLYIYENDVKIILNGELDDKFIWINWEGL